MQQGWRGPTLCFIYVEYTFIKGAEVRAGRRQALRLVNYFIKIVQYCTILKYYNIEHYYNNTQYIFPPETPNFVCFCCIS